MAAGGSTATNKKAGARPAFSKTVPQVRWISVPRNSRAAELVVEASGDHVDVLANTVGPDRGSRHGDRAGGNQADVTVPHEQMVVFDANRPVRCKAVFEADADRGAPAGVAGRIKRGAG